MGPLSCHQHFLPPMTKDGTGKLIYITSKSGSVRGKIDNHLRKDHIGLMLTCYEQAPDYDKEVTGYRMVKAAAN